MTKRFLKFILPVAILIIMGPDLFAQDRHIVFESLTSQNGLSNNDVQFFHQDKQGFIWIGTRKGLNKYDGYNFFHYKHNSGDSLSLSNNYINCIQEDSDGNFWIGTANGLNKFNPYLGQRLPVGTGKNALEKWHISSLEFDFNGQLWIGTQRNGLYRAIIVNSETCDLDSLNIFPVNIQSANINNVSNKKINFIHQDLINDNLIWIGTPYGLTLLNKNTNEEIQYFFNPRNPNQLTTAETWSIYNEFKSIYQEDNGTIWVGAREGLIGKIEKNSTNGLAFTPFYLGTERLIFSICEAQQGNLWIGTQTDGLFKFNKNTGESIQFNLDTPPPRQINHICVFTTFTDKWGTVWVGTRNGINKYDPNKITYIQYTPESTGSSGLSSEKVFAFCEDIQNNLWIGTWGKGLDILDLKTGQFRKATFNRALCSPWITALCQDDSGFIWIGTINGLDRYDPVEQNIQHFRCNLNTSVHDNPLCGNYIFTLYKDQAGNIWVATNRGLTRFTFFIDDSLANQHFLYQDSTVAALGYFFGATIRDYSGNLWIGANDLYLFNPQANTLDRKPLLQDSSETQNVMIGSLYEDQKGNLWVGTYGDGLFLMGNNPIHFTEKDGLPSNLVYGIVEDDNGFLWLSTFKGLVTFNPDTKTFKTYDLGEGIKRNEFYPGSFHKGKSGRFYFGNLSGFISFFPQQFAGNTYIPPVYISDFKIFNESINFKRPIHELANISLKYNQNMVSFEFVALNYTESRKNLYQYRLQGLETDWNTSRDRRFVNYTNIPPGEYSFQVKAANNEGIWNEEGVSVRIIISPPWWKTWWAYSIYLFLFLSILYSGYRFILNRERMRQQLKMEHEQAEKLQEIDQMKSRFFANISHEFRTPLTLILGPLEQLMEKTRSRGMKNQYKMMLRNAKRLLQLINQIFDLSRLEAGKMTANKQPEEVIELIKGWVGSFESLAKQKEITLVCHSNLDQLHILVDREKLESIINNLVSNAVKFTPKGGEVMVTVLTNDPEWLDISVKDSGIGIAKQHQVKIFERFYQVEEPDGYDHSGSGIGLALVKELVELLGGTIKLESEINKGTTFIVSMPIEYAQPLLTAKESVPVKDESGFEIPQETDRLVKISEDPPMLLVIEDNKDLQNYMSHLLGKYYRIKSALDGNQGFETAIEWIPDLIISDVMMPGIDGFELCKKLKTDERTSHIPVILLTARAAVTDKLGGLKTGADDYLTKPFDVQELLLRTKNLINQRRKLREKFSREIHLHPGDITISSIDEQFLKRTISIIEDNMSDFDFSVASLSKEVAMSRTQLHRKLKALTDKSPSEFIRFIRLKRAAKLLQKRSGTVSEIAFSVGFNNLSYFSKCFRRQYGKLPSEYAKQK